ncbi:GNAT family N-acetyltransferase [Trichocoleus sp. FACHB-591]|uniref:GNAT family N-acetyltransferase n=1 Tax=Trichocoleus sp. FACHB-591 TaxID=2692872 RepID=UPI001682593C|nr:GNAT family N-acetyltransferase [Trichocoleus sp. FACHB-591]MBD2095311.1 GNAT family N-acetyltransferase [Trichocoleus sp. FACHB-591]
MLPKSLYTERLLLRPPRLEDANAIFQTYAQDPEVTRYLIWQPHQSITETQAFLTECLAAWHQGDRFPWIMTRAEDGQLLGMIELRLEGHRAEVGYVLARQFWGQGYVTEALRAVLKAGLALPQLYRIEAQCDVENIASARVMEKAGMMQEGVLRRFMILQNLSQEPRDVYSYALTR